MKSQLIEKKKTISIFSSVAFVVAILFSLFQLITGGFYTLPALLARSAHVGLILALVFLVKPWKKGAKQNIFDFFFAILSLIVCGYIWAHYDTLIHRLYWVTPLSTIELIMGIVFVLLVLEATRRSIGLVLTIICVIFLLYGIFGHLLPYPFSHGYLRSFQLLDQLYYSTEGVFGTSIAVSTNYIAMFIIFGSALNGIGGGKFFMDISLAIAGKRTGGPAQVAAVSSGLFGSISGAAVANVATTGVVTIPLMKRVGYTPEFAGAVEAVASTGGQIMPPVMASVAFLISEYVGIPYIQVVKHAIIPALLYFGACMTMIYLESKRLGIKGLDASEIPSARETLASGWYYLLPLISLIALMMMNFSTSFAVFWSIVLILLIGFLKRKERLSLRGLIDILVDGAKQVIPVAMACAAAGIVIGIINITGVGLKFSTLVINIAGSNMFLALVLTAITVIILGMGLPTAAAYIVCVSLIVPALIKMGVATIAAHFFVFYFAIISSITPPVALATFAASGIAQSHFWKTGYKALKLGIAAFIVPFMFVYSPSLLLAGTGYDQIATFITAPIGILLLSIALVGHWRNARVSFPLRALSFAGALLLIFPTMVTDIVGAVIAIIVLFSKDFLRIVNKRLVKNE